jgi:hypothetical protein
MFVAGDEDAEPHAATRAFRTRGVGIGSRVILTVGPDGVRLREGPTVPWSAIERISVEDDVLTIQPHVGAGAAIELRLDRIAEDDDEVLDAIAAHHLVDER